MQIGYWTIIYVPEVQSFEPTLAAQHIVIFITLVKDKEKIEQYAADLSAMRYLKVELAKHHVSHLQTYLLTQYMQTNDRMCS